MIPNEQTEIEIRIWPLRIIAKGNRAVAALKWPFSFIMVAIGLATAAVIAMKGISLLG